MTSQMNGRALKVDFLPTKFIVTILSRTQSHEKLRNILLKENNVKECHGCCPCQKWCTCENCRHCMFGTF